MYCIVVTIYVTILTIYKTRVVMQRGHAGTILTSLQSRVLTMLPKHNNLNINERLTSGCPLGENRRLVVVIVSNGILGISTPLQNYIYLFTMWPALLMIANYRSKFKSSILTYSHQFSTYSLGSNLSADTYPSKYHHGRRYHRRVFPRGWFSLLPQVDI
jgi:hypothetical protein